MQDMFTWERDGANSWKCPVLEKHFRSFGEVTDVWFPWRREDERYFARVWFRHQRAAEEAVSASRHLIEGEEFLANFHRPPPRTARASAGGGERTPPSASSSGPSTRGAGAQETAGHHRPQPRRRGRVSQEEREADTEVDQFLRPISAGEYQELRALTWRDYLAPRDLKEALQRIGEDLVPEKLQQRRASKRKLFGSADIQAPGIPIVLFEGPPGTGKTFGMKVLAVQSGLQPWILDVKGLQEKSWQAEALFARILDRISALEKAVVFVDECEVLFPRREVMAGYESVDVRSHKKMIGAFLQWAEGLATRSYSAGQAPPLLCLATNLREQMDKAVQDRARTIVTFALPTPAQCAHWWSLHARQLGATGHREGGGVAAKHWVLGWLTWGAGLSFRGMWSIAEKMVDLDAKRSADDVGEAVDDVPKVMEGCIF